MSSAYQLAEYRLHILQTAFLCYILASCHCVYGSIDDSCPPWNRTEDEMFTSDDGALCFVYSHDKYSWLQSEQICREAGWSLVKISSEEKQRFFERNAKVLWKDEKFRHNGLAISVCFWIGLTDLANEGDFRWIDGAPMGYNLMENRVFFLNRFFDCVAFCTFDKEKFTWVPSWCTYSILKKNNGFVCENDAVRRKTKALTTEKPEAARLTSRTQKPRGFVELKNSRGLQLKGKRHFSVKCPSSTCCTRECSRRPPCAVFNYHQPTFTCNGYSSLDALTEDREPGDDWKIWVELPSS